WDPDGKLAPKGFSDQAELSSVFKDMVLGVDQLGCGYEQSLEAVYRFLVDPEPYERIEVTEERPRIAKLVGIDEKLLQQRRDFLRPDSLVAIVSLSDENDCSMIPEGQGFNVLGGSFHRARSACKENPNDVCCFSCGSADREGCTPKASDPECQINDGRLDNSEHSDNLRCFDQKRYYGVDFLFPTKRYVDALTQQVVPNRQGEMVQNPLFSDLQCENGVGCK